MSTVTLTDATFEQAVTREGIVLVDFWASWCGPCLLFGPVFEKASAKHPDITFAKVDTDAERGVSSAASIASIPTLMGFRDGILVFRQAGALRAAALDEIISGIRALDMDDVRARVAAAQATPSA